MSSTQAPQQRLCDVPVHSPNEAFNLLIRFLNLAQSRGAYKLDESAKIFECMKAFEQPSEIQPSEIQPAKQEQGQEQEQEQGQKHD